MEDGIDVVSGAAVVVPCFGHQECVPRHAGRCVGAVGPLDLRRRVTVDLTDELLGVTLEHWDYLWKLSGVDGGLICSEKNTKFEKNNDMQR